MGRQIIKQPNGKYCIFSSIVDNVTYCDMTEEDIINVWTEEAKEDIERQVKEIILNVEKGEESSYNWKLSYEDMFERISEVHGSEEAEKVKKEINFINKL